MRRHCVQDAAGGNGSAAAGWMAPMPIDPLITLGGKYAHRCPPVMQNRSICHKKSIKALPGISGPPGPRATADYRSSNYRVGGICPAAHSTTMPTLQLRCIPNSHCITAHDLEPWVHFQQTQGRSLHCTTRPLQLGQTVALEETLIQSEQSHIKSQSGAVEVEVAPTTG